MKRGVMALGLLGSLWLAGVAVAEQVPEPKLAVPETKSPVTEKGALTAPSAQQLKGLRAMQDAAKSYEQAAKEYKQLLTTIVRHHYEERRRRIVSGLEKDIKIESEKLANARPFRAAGSQHRLPRRSIR